MTRKRILVTGGAGFIGSAAVGRLVAAGCQVTTADLLTYAGHRETLAEVLDAPNHRFACIDICDAEAVDGIVREARPDCVMHFAAESHVDRSIEGPLEFVRTNMLGTATLLHRIGEYWRELGDRERRDFRFLHVSTDEVYGALGAEGLFTEDSAYRPNSPYAASKAGSDHLVRAWHVTYGLPVLTAHCSNNYGPRQLPEKLVPRMTIAALEGRELPIYGDGSQIRDWLFVEDNVRALEDILRHGEPGEVFGIGADCQRTNLDMVRAICALMDELRPDSPFRPHAELMRFVKDRPGHDFRYATDSAKLTRRTGWKPAIGLDEGLRRTVSWYLGNETWRKAVMNDARDGRG